MVECITLFFSYQRAGVFLNGIFFYIVILNFTMDYYMPKTSLTPMTYLYYLSLLSWIFTVLFLCIFINRVDISNQLVFFDVRL